MTNRRLYREYLAQVFEDRCQRNPRYSLRAFARDLNLSAPRLSGILLGKFGLSRLAAESISQRLSLNAAEREWFCDSVEAEHARSTIGRMKATERLAGRSTPFLNLATEQFRLISDWYHFAIMELTDTGTYSQSDSDRMAKRLGITVHECEQALKRLLEFDLLEVSGEGTLRMTGNFLVNADGLPSDAIRRHQIQLLRRAENAIQDQPVEEREIRSITVSVNDRQIVEVKEMIREFQKALHVKLQENQEAKQEVYAFTLQFFRLTDNQEESS